jgi:hypothetical protein
MAITAMNQTCSCPCGRSTLVAPARPLARFLCHCTICQSVYKLPYADVTVHWAGGIVLKERSALQFKKYRLPPAVDRGLCGSCGAPVAGLLRLAPFVQLGFVASATYPNQAALPEPDAHIFYHSRGADIDDSLPKHSGYWRSELAVVSMILSGAFHRSAHR